MAILLVEQYFDLLRNWPQMMVVMDRGDIVLAGGGRILTRRMSDGGCRSEGVSLQRAVGELRVAVKRFGAETVLDELSPGWLPEGGGFRGRVVPGWMDVVMLNTGGALPAGIGWTCLLLSGSMVRRRIAARRRSDSIGVGHGSASRATLTGKPGGALEWLPQETILFDHCALDRRWRSTLRRMRDCRLTIDPTVKDNPADPRRQRRRRCSASTTSIHRGTTRRGNRAFRQPTLAKFVQHGLRPNRLTATRNSPTARCSENTLDRQPPSDIRLVKISRRPARTMSPRSMDDLICASS